MKVRFPCVLIVTGFVWLALGDPTLRTAIAVVRPPAGVLPDYDAASGLKIGLAPGDSPKPAQLEAIRKLENQRGSRVAVIYNGVSRVPRSLNSATPLSDPSDESPVTIARSFLRQHRDVWELTDAEIDALRPDTQYTDAHNGLTHVYFTQMLGGVAVFPSSLGLSLDAKGRVISVRGDVFPGLAMPAAARLTPEAAAEAAATNIGVSYQAARLRVERNTVILSPGDFRSPVAVQPVIYSLLDSPRRAYQMSLEKNGLEWYMIIIDAEDGRLLHRSNIYQFIGTITPSSPPEASPATPRGLIFCEHPLSTVRGTGDADRKYPYTTDPTGQSRGFASSPLFGADNRPVILHGGDPANATVAQTLLPLPNAANPFRSNALPLSSSPQSPVGWFTLQSGEYHTIGNNVDCKEDHAADNESTIGMRGNAGTVGDFSGAAFTYQHAYGQNGPYANTAARLAGAAPDLPAVTTNLFYLNNWYHDLLYHLGFTEAAGNFQTDNFGRGGLGGDHVLADAQDGSGLDNANFGTPTDGSNPRMQMFLFTSPDRDGSLDFDIVIHEYSHGLTNRLVGGPGNSNCLLSGLVGEAGGMGEGWGDWYAAVISDDPTVAEYSFNNTNDGIRRFSMNRGPNDFTYGFICSGPPSDPSLIPCESHDVGEFWSIVLWETREAIINRVHNRTFPGGPTFPTYTVTGSPAGNIRNAQGRTTDGSGAPAQIDHATIESATFAAMFRVTDALKLAPCNPSMVNMRDAILAADRAYGGEFQDVIWRAFANRGIGDGAFSNGGATPTVVESFAVPQEVSDCEVAGGPLPAPAFTAVSNVANTVDITITPNGAAQYIIYRGVSGAGSTLDPRPFSEIARVTTSSYQDTGLNGGLTYYYRVVAARNDSCLSSSQVNSVIPLGNPLPCATRPTFAGLSRVVSPGNCQSLILEWSSGTSNCPSGPNLRYNVYRGTTPTFVPSGANRIATAVVGNSYVDSTAALNTLYYYVVRAEDSTTGGSGPSNGGNEDTNTIRRASLVTSASLTHQNYSDDVEAGPDNLRSTHFTSNGFTSPTLPTRGGWFREENPTLITPRSPTHVWHTYNPDNRSIAPDGNTVYELRSDIITITPTSILTWYQTFQTEPRFDGGVVEAALVDAGGTAGAFSDIGHLIYENPYNGVMDADGSDNTLFGRQGYTGGALGPMQRTRAFVGAMVPTGEPNQRIIVRFLFGTDVANVITVPPIIEGTYFPGWYIDDVSLDETCCPVSPAPTDLQAMATGNNQISLEWTAPQGSLTSYRIYREQVSDQFPVVFDDLIGTVPGSQTTFVDNAASGGLTFAYVVQAIPDGGCPSGLSEPATATAIGVCQVVPTFAGIKRVTAPPRSNCTLDLSWNEGFANCPGAEVRYNIYRDTNPTFTPGPSNLIEAGVSGSTYRDTYQLMTSVTYYYIIRAEDSTNGGSGPANGGNEENNLVRLSGSPIGILAAGPDFNDDMEPAANSGYSTFSTRDAGGWQVIADPTAHSATNAWVCLDDQPGSPTLTSKDDRLNLPPLNLSSTSVLTFWHNFDFARRTPPSTVSYHSGGVIELSADGETWVDLGPYITSGGYNGTVTATAMSPLAGRMAWVGSSDGGPDSPIPGRADAMLQVVVNLGAAIQNPGTFNATTLPAARIRFRLGGTFQIITLGLQGTGWGIDDIAVSQLLSPQACNTCATCTGDLNADGKVDGRDVRPFITCALESCEVTVCADFNGDGVLNLEDLPQFVNKLLSDPNTLCP